MFVCGSFLSSPNLHHALIYLCCCSRLYVVSLVDIGTAKMCKFTRKRSSHLVDVLTEIYYLLEWHFTGNVKVTYKMLSIFGFFEPILLLNMTRENLMILNEKYPSNRPNLILIHIFCIFLLWFRFIAEWFC